MHIIDPYRQGVGSIEGVYWSHALNTGCPDPKNSGHNNQIFHNGNPVEGWDQANNNYDYNFYPNYKWIDNLGTVRQNEAPDGVRVFFDYRADSSGDSAPLQKCYISGSFCDGNPDATGCDVDEYVGGVNNYGLPTDPGNHYWESLEMATDGTGGSSTVEYFTALSQPSPWVYRYFFVQYRIRITDASGATMASDWNGRFHVNVENKIIEYANNAWNGPSWDSGGTCPHTYAVETGACTPNPGEDCHIVGDPLDVFFELGAVDDWVMFDIDGLDTDWHCGTLLSAYGQDRMWAPDHPDSEMYFSAGAFLNCADCQANMP